MDGQGARREQMENFAVEVMEVGETALALRLLGEMDTFSAPLLGRAIERFAPTSSLRLICDGLSFVDAGGIQAILDAEQRQLSHGTFHVVDPSPLLRRLLSICALDRLLES